MIGVLLAASIAFAPSGLAFDFRSGGGLDVRMHGVPVVQGSWFQFYEPGWTKGYYSSLWGEQSVENPAPGRSRMTFRSDDGRASGSQQVSLEGNRLTVEYEFLWTGESVANVEIAVAQLWAPSLDRGRLLIDGNPTRSLAPTVYASVSDIDERAYGRGNRFVFEAPIGRVQIEVEGFRAVVFDARGYNQDFAQGRDLWWLGASDIPLEPGKPWRGKMTLTFEGEAGAMEGTEVERLPLVRLGEAVSPRTDPLPLVPKPKEANLNGVIGRPTRLEFGSVGGTDPTATHIFESAVARMWDIGPRGHMLLPDYRFEIRNQGLPPEGYTIEIPTRADLPIRVTGQDRDGLRHGVETLARLIRHDGRRLVLPTGTIRDYPTVSWRGVHLFVGPTAREFHGNLWSRVLGPMRFNKVVVQCERTDWLAAPGIQTDITMSRRDLVGLFADYRARGVEPIPLIQSFGHMGWLFANGQNLDLAFNRDVPFSIDPRKPEARQKVAAIWDEAIALLRPRVVHFGLDEVDMRGFPNDPREITTELWRIQIPFLNDLARRHNVRPMLWGDKGLAPGEAIDAAHGHDPVNAKARREVIAPGAYIADWHYAANLDPEPFRRSLQIWKNEGFVPIASTWFKPENIYGFTHAAIKEGVGVLQTTWAGYESRESEMIREYHQFWAMVLTADYAWSGRTEKPDELPYDPSEVFRRLYFEGPRPVLSAEGTALGSGPPFSVGSTRFHRMRTVALRNLMVEGGGSMPVALDLPVDGGRAVRSVRLAVDTLTRLGEGHRVAEVVVTTASGETVRMPLLYGRHVRHGEDNRALMMGERGSGLSAVSVDLPRAQPIRSIRIEATNLYGGLRVHGVTLVH